MALSPEERATVASELLDSLPNDGLHPEWTAEIERRARRAWQDPDGGEPWDAVEERLRSRLPPR
jgi:putative addiction module component (TIGR02574 family)